MKFSYKTTIYACFLGYIVQAVINNFIPLLFINFHTTYDIPLSEITMLVSINFAIQLIIDLCSISFIDKLGYRTCIVIAHIFATAGILSLTILPDITPSPFSGILISVIIYAVGGGLLEVLVSPIVESCPSDNKEKTMSLLHSFYCWGHVGVVLLSTVFFTVFGIDNWHILAYFWALFPLLNVFIFIKTPIAHLIKEDEQSMTLRELFKNSTFWLFMLMMLCAGASEQAISQWASAFAELGLGISKTAGDLAGPLAFATLMGLSRVFYGKYGDKIDLDRFMTASSLLAIVSYLIASLSPVPILSLLGCALSGLAVGIMWPGCFSKAASSMRLGGTAMFALLALAGDFGCSFGPSVVGAVSSLANDNLKLGILAAVAFPVVLVLCLIFGKKTYNRTCSAKKE